MADVSPKVRLKASAYPRIAGRVFDTPLLIHQKKLDSILSVLGPRLGFGSSVSMEASEYETRYSDDGYMVSGNVAIIPVMGPLIHHYDFISEACGMCSYETLGVQFAKAMADNSIKSILFNFDSPGGEVAGCYDLAEKIYQARGQKHIVAVLNDFAFSAAYLLASACTEIAIPIVGMAGSIGVVTAHIDQSKQLEMAGIAVTWIYAGAKKVDGVSTAPISESASADVQEMVDDVYELLTTTVARNRGIPVQAVIDTEAGSYLGPKAISAGLADRIGTYGEELTALGLRQDEPIRSVPPQEEDVEMSDANKGGGAEAAAAETARIAAEAAESARKIEAAKSEGMAAGATAAKTRISAIVGSEDAKQRPKLANHLAFETDMSAEAAVSVLKASAVETVTTPAPAAAASPLTTAMNASGGGTGVGGDPATGDDDKPDEVKTAADNILAFVTKPAAR